MTREDRLLIRGWTDALKGLPPDTYDDELYREGYKLWLEAIGQKRLRKAKLGFRTPAHRRQ